MLLFRLYLHIKLSLIEKVKSEKIYNFSCSQSWGLQSTRSMFYFQLVMFRPMHFYEKGSESHLIGCSALGLLSCNSFWDNHDMKMHVCGQICQAKLRVLHQLQKNDTRFTKIFNKQMQKPGILWMMDVSILRKSELSVGTDSEWASKWIFSESLLFHPLKSVVDI